MDHAALAYSEIAKTTRVVNDHETHFRPKFVAKLFNAFLNVSFSNPSI